MTPLLFAQHRHLVTATADTLARLVAAGVRDLGELEASGPEGAALARAIRAEQERQAQALIPSGDGGR